MKLLIEVEIDEKEIENLKKISNAAGLKIEQFMAQYLYSNLFLREAQKIRNEELKENKEIDLKKEFMANLKKMKISQDVLAAYVPTSQATVSRWLKGESFGFLDILIQKNKNEILKEILNFKIEKICEELEKEYSLIEGGGAEIKKLDLIEKIILSGFSKAKDQILLKNELEKKWFYDIFKKEIQNLKKENEEIYLKAKDTKEYMDIFSYGTTLSDIAIINAKTKFLDFIKSNQIPF